MPAEPTDLPQPSELGRKKIAALLIVYLNALQNSPVIPEDEWASAEEMKQRIAQEL